jgi:hypothetical protein
MKCLILEEEENQTRKIQLWQGVLLRKMDAGDGWALTILVDMRGAHGIIEIPKFIEFCMNLNLEM